LKKNPSNSRDYIILDSPEANIVYIGNYGKAQCGYRGNLLEESPTNYIPIASSLLRFPAEKAFIVKAYGDSMEPKIFEGDIIIVKKQTHAKHGDTIVCSYKEEVLIKRFFRQGNLISLISFNQEKYSPIIISDENELNISGIVKNIISYT